MTAKTERTSAVAWRLSFLSWRILFRWARTSTKRTRLPARALGSSLGPSLGSSNAPASSPPVWSPLLPSIVLNHG
eukprot:CAMPEP_0171617686 /NCGR_PEP_ID=MMETSP0990-20121206/14263_1 /TAXON_ID=483369 /ORGANISM="non described non described, Strain CCMP2098" /LENGTH=74 /DNA_ID=CAMNT_0012182275 /DNA_START=328 /DNA_END=552 /DNA_ORIENTATION=-